MSPLEIIGAISAVLALVIALGGAAALVRSSYNRARMAALAEDNEDLRDRIEDRDKELIKVEGQRDALKTKSDHLEQENESLTKLVTQKANVDEVLGELQTHHREAKAAWTRILAELQGEEKS